MTITLNPINLLITIPQDERAAAWKGRRFTRQGAGFRTIDAAEERQRNKLRREYEREQEKKRKERFEAFLESRRG